MPAPRHARRSRLSRRRRYAAGGGMTFLAATAVVVPLASSAAPPTVKTQTEPARDTTHVQEVSPVAVARIAQANRYLVRPGDTLSCISGRVCGDPGDYLALAYNNGLANPDRIYAGQLLKTACQAAAQAVAGKYGLLGSAPARPPASTPAPAPSRQAAPPVQEPVVTVASGTFGCAALEALWRGAGGNPADAFTAAEIAMAESGGNPNAVSPTMDKGLWQINQSHGTLSTYDPLGNARAAVEISNDGANWSAWTTWREGLEIGKC